MSITGTEATSALSERYEALILVSQAIRVHRDLPDVFHGLMTALRPVLQFDGMVIGQIDPASNEMMLHVSGLTGRTATTLRPLPPPEDNIVKWVFDHQEPILIPSLAKETRFQSVLSMLREKGIQSLCMLPLTTIHRPIGAIGVASKIPDAFSAEDVRFLSLVAGQTALAIDDALNFERSKAAQAELEEKRERLELLLKINNAVVSSLDVRDLFRAISSSIRSALRCDAVGILLPDASDKKLEGYGLDFPESKRVLTTKVVIPPAMQRVFETGVPATFTSIDSDGTDPMMQAEGLNAICHFPLNSRKGTLGVLGLGRKELIPFTQKDLQLLGELGAQVAIAVENALAYRKIGELKDQLTRENVYLEDEIRSELNFEEIIGRSESLGRLLRQVETVAPTESTVLIYGDTGTGKELIARALHNLSSRGKRAFVKLNCAAIPTGLLESELFGHERGAFTGAVSQRIGRFELASQGTVFLDEIGEIPLELQPKLLRVLQEREFERLGSSHTLRTEARLIAATNRDLSAMVAEQKFRADLYYRLSVFPLYVPPLRERQEDIPLLVRHFVQLFSRRMNKAVDTIPSETMSLLVRYHWPGNIRELQNLIERAVILSSGSILKVPVSDLQAQPVSILSRPKIETLEDSERRHILDALDATNWVIAGAGGAAKMLGLKRSTLQARMEKLGIRRARAAG